MAEIALGVIGAAATVGAAGLTAGSGFTCRHESSHRQEIMEIRRNTDDFLENLQSGDVTPGEEREFLATRDEAIRRGDEYHGSIEGYKDISWVNIVAKLSKKEEVRKKKRAIRQSNHSLRSLNESMHSGSDTSSISAQSGSPPGSSLAADDIHEWASAVQSRDEPADHEDGSPQMPTSPDPRWLSDYQTSLVIPSLPDYSDAFSQKPKQNTAERRASHYAVERARRATLNARFFDLAALLPNLNHIRRPSKLAIVNSSIAHVRAERRHRELASQQLRVLNDECDVVRREINQWRARVDIHPVVAPPRSEGFALVLGGEGPFFHPVDLEGVDDEDADYRGYSRYHLATPSRTRE
ncbi:hypothetical protein K438DRAFT_1883718 [Mycena galopus ATCC 62051]|nr:hypothetical protein K438DRAFT_1883718 [Mycena galopus ATCC 62051]